MSFIGTPCGSWDSRIRPAETPSTIDFGCEKSGCSRKSSVLVMGLFKLSYQSWYLADPAQSDGQRHNDVAQAHNGWNDIRQEQEGLAGLVTGQTQVISCQLDAVGQVEEEAQHCQYVENGYWPAAKGCHHVGLNSASYECIRRCRCNTHGEIQDVENNEEQEHDAGDQHGAGRKGAHAAHQVGATELAARLT